MALNSHRIPGNDCELPSTYRNVYLFIVLLCQRCDRFITSLPPPLCYLDYSYCEFSCHNLMYSDFYKHESVLLEKCIILTANKITGT